MMKKVTPSTTATAVMMWMKWLISREMGVAGRGVGEGVQWAETLHNYN